MPFKRFDDKLVQGEHLNFQDKGIVSKGAKTHKFAVNSRYDHSFLGYVRYKAQWRQYVLFPLNCVLNKDCLREVADYCEAVTAAHREKRQAFAAAE
jgi:hypothetical protein